MVKNAYKKGNTDNSVAFSGIFMPEKDAIRSFRAFSKKPTVERQGDAPPIQRVFLGAFVSGRGIPLRVPLPLKNVL